MSNQTKPIEPNAFVMYNKEDVPFAWDYSQKETDNHIVVKGVKFSAKTGRILSSQQTNQMTLWEPISYPEQKVELIPYKDVATRIELFNLNELQTVKVNSEEINFDSFEQQPTIQNFSEFIFSILEKENIPKDAKIINYDEFSIVVSYTRKETMEEITFRLYSSIEYEIKKNEYEMNKQLEIMKTHQEKLDQIKEKIRNQKNKYEEIKSNA